MSRADQCQQRCQAALDFDMPERHCAPGACQYKPTGVDFAAALETARGNKGFSNLARAYIELVKRAQAGGAVLDELLRLQFKSDLVMAAPDIFKTVRAAANDLEPVSHLKVKKHG